MANKFNLTDENGNISLSGNLETREGDYPHALLSLNCGIECGFEIADGRLRVLIYDGVTEEPSVIEMGTVKQASVLQKVRQPSK